jgi:hypothetical protein
MKKPLKAMKKETIEAGGERHVVYEKPNNIGKGKKGDIMVTHPDIDLGKWTTIDLTDVDHSMTIAEGVAAVKKWHKEHPQAYDKNKKYKEMKG